jgi:hypothetical protein
MIQKSDRQNEQFGHFSNFMKFYFQIKILKSLYLILIQSLGVVLI